MNQRQSLVLIHGTLCDRHLFDRQVRRLRASVQITVADLHHLRAAPDWARSLLDRLPPRFSVAGFSLGGLLALELLRQAPERVERLALITSNAEGGTRRGQRRQQALSRLWRTEGPAAVARRVKPAYLDHHTQRRRHAGPAPRAMLIVSGANSRLCPRSLQLRRHTCRPDARWTELPRCGHMVPLEAPVQLTQLLGLWLAEPALTCSGELA